MFENLDIFRMSSAMAKHAGQRQAVVAQNVANADTPGYRRPRRARFCRQLYARDSAGMQRATRGRHLNGSVGAESLPAIVEVRRSGARTATRCRSRRRC